MRRWAVAVVAPFVVVTLVALALLWPGAVERETPDVAGAGQAGGTVVAVDREECPEPLPDDVNGCGSATVEVDEVDGAPVEVGARVETTLPNGTGAARIEVGHSVVLLHMSTPDGGTFSIVDHRRATGMWILAAAFVLAVVAFGRWRGVRSLLGLGVTFLVLLYFVVPGILEGSSPVAMALAGSAAIVLSVMYLTHGLTLSTTVALVGTLVSLALTGLLAWIAVAGLHLTGVTDDVSTMPWISPDYFEHRYPEEWSRQAVFYVGVTLVRPDMRRDHVFTMMAKHVGNRVAAARGVLGYDICAYNDQDRSLGRVTARLLNRLSTFEVRPIDVQTYYVARAIAVPGEQEEQGQKGGGEA